VPSAEALDAKKIAPLSSLWRDWGNTNGSTKIVAKAVVRMVTERIVDLSIYEIRQNRYILSGIGQRIDLTGRSPRLRRSVRGTAVPFLPVVLDLQTA
jgi:hypothetical protein